MQSFKFGTIPSQYLMHDQTGVEITDLHKSFLRQDDQQMSWQGWARSGRGDRDRRGVSRDRQAFLVPHGKGLKRLFPCLVRAEQRPSLSTGGLWSSVGQSEFCGH